LFDLEGDSPSEFFEKVDLDGTPWYWKIKIACHTPGAKGAIVTKVEQVGGWGHVYSLEVTPWQFGGTQELEPWKPGVHLFTIGMTHLLLDSNTIATVVVPPQLKAPIMFSENAVQKMLTISQRRTRAVYPPLERLLFQYQKL